MALLAGFAIVGVSSIAMLATYKGITSQKVSPYGESVEIWGTFDAEVMRLTLQSVTDEDKEFRVVSYKEMDPRSFEEDLVNAIAENRAPDAIILEHEDLVTYRPKLLAVPFEVVPLRTLKDKYIDGAEIFARNDGLFAIPIAVDPLVMYWNRDIMANSGVSLPPQTWESLSQIVQQITLRDATRNIQLSTVAFGEYRNVEHAKEALLTLSMQSGSRLIEEDKQGYVVAIDEAVSADARKPLSTALQFFVEFSNANSPLYSWNRSISNDLFAFLGGDLAFYFGYGSEAKQIQERNPNLNFDVTQVPQGAGNTVKRVYGKFYGLAILKSSDNSQGTYAALAKLGSPAPVAKLTEELGLAPAHRSTITQGSQDPFRQTVLNASLIARGWLDPDPSETGNILQEMVEDVVSNRQKVSGAVSDAVRRLELAF